MTPREFLHRHLAGRLPDPHAFLGAHPALPAGVVVRAYDPSADRMTLVLSDPRDRRIAMKPLAAEEAPGIFEAVVPDGGFPFPYRLEVSRPGGVGLIEDPYRFGPTLGELDLFLLGEGTHRELYRRLGAHRRTLDGVGGFAFAVWAPSAAAVSLVGDFNGWDPRRHPMRQIGASGVWEIFMPGTDAGAVYKYQIRSADGLSFDKADPVGFAMEHRPRTASVTYEPGRFQWTDRSWIERRLERDTYRLPMAIYEVHLGSWRRAEGGRWLSYPELADQLIPYVKDLGYTHLQLLPPLEHPFDGSWGYQVTGYFAPTSRHGSPDDFRAFVDRAHQAGIGVLIDWVPAHFPKDAHALARFDGTCLYEHEDPRQGEHPDWDTLIFNYGRHEVRSFLLSSALFWLDEMHVDGLRVDAVSSMLYLDYSRQHGQWVPNVHGGRENLEAIEFVRSLNRTVYEAFPGSITVAEESTSWPGVSRPAWTGGLGFGYKWNMGWMHDILAYFGKDPVYRKYLHSNLTFALLYAFDENFILALSHDEVVHGKGSLFGRMPGDAWQKFANLRLLYAYQYAQPGKKLLFMGGELGQEREWNHDAGLDWHLLGDDRHRGIHRLVKDLNHLYTAEPALWEQDHEPQGFRWIDFSDAESSIVSFIRYGATPGDYVIGVFNFTPVPRSGYALGVPEARAYREILNTDSRHYGGSDLGNLGSRQAIEGGMHGQPCHLELTLPPLAALWLKPA